TWLLVNAAQPDRYSAAVDSAADVVLYDVEDAVAPKDKDFARKNVIDWFASGHTGWVRINGYGSPWWEKDVTELAKYITHELDGPHHNGGLLGVMLAMTESTDHVNETAARLPGVPIIALVETARGLQRIHSIAAARGTFRLALGIGDFGGDTGFGNSPMALAYPAYPLLHWSRPLGAYHASTPSQQPGARSVWPSVSATSAAIPVLATHRWPWPMRVANSPLLPKPQCCRPPLMDQPRAPQERC